jgi:hypothetical protein
LLPVPVLAKLFPGLMLHKLGMLAEELEPAGLVGGEESRNAAVPREFRNVERRTYRLYHQRQ